MVFGVNMDGYSACEAAWKGIVAVSKYYSIGAAIWGNETHLGGAESRAMGCKFRYEAVDQGREHRVQTCILAKVCLQVEGNRGYIDGITQRLGFDLAGGDPLQPPKRGRGRPKSSKNKAKDESSTQPVHAMASGGVQSHPSTPLPMSYPPPAIENPSQSVRNAAHRNELVEPFANMVVRADTALHSHPTISGQPIRRLGEIRLKQRSEHSDRRTNSTIFLSC
ncbi:hypothetical protein B0H11DRAFT_1934740 [Mycena galericulata]|nr:hypothetical protein B0H11DRAFT_1934740 [Mycena galericulata]